MPTLADLSRPSTGLLGDFTAGIDQRKRQIFNLAMGLLSNPEDTIAMLRAGDAEAHQRNLRTPAMDGSSRSVMPEIAQQGRDATMDVAMSVGGLLGMAKGHAPKGGTIGVNGERYEGGMFLPSSSATEKGKMQFPKAMRAGNVAEVAPGERAARPFDGAMPVMRQAEFDWPAYRQTGALQPFSGWSEYAKNPALLNDAAAHADAFNKGARWVKDGQYFDAVGNPL